jgi:DNA-binding response OmpR family regulator
MLKVGACTPSVDLNLNRCMNIEKVVWLSQRSEPHWGAEFLVRYFQEENFVIYCATQSQLRSAKIEDFQLFLIEAKDAADAAILEMILDLRVQTLALIVILVEEASSAQVVQLLGSGADAVWMVNEPIQVLRARAKSLLRRCKGFTIKI